MQSTSWGKTYPLWKTVLQQPLQKKKGKKKTFRDAEFYIQSTQNP